MSAHEESEDNVITAVDGEDADGTSSDKSFATAQAENNLSSEGSEEELTIKRKTRRARDSVHQRTAKTPANTKRKKVTKDEKKAVKNAQQLELVERLFATLDRHDNGRFTARDLLAVADDHGQFFTSDEVHDMIRFWDTSGTCTIDRDNFRQIALDCNYLKDDLPSQG